MKGTRYGLAAFALAFCVGCGGARVSQLEDAVVKCQTEKGELSQQIETLESENAELQTKADQMAKLAAARKALHDDLQSALLNLIDAGQLTISIRNGMVTLAMPSAILFDTGKAKLKDGAKETIVKVATAIKGVDRKFLVAGHTDNVSVKKKAKKFRDNWELASARAYSVYTILSSAGVQRSNLAVAGFGDADPVGDNASDEGKAANRRVEIIVMPNMEAVLPMEAMAEPADDEETDANAES